MSKFFCALLQNELSVQFDDLFKKAWEEDVTEFEKVGMYLHAYICNVYCFL